MDYQDGSKINEISIKISEYFPHRRGLSTLAKKLMAATRVWQTSSIGLSTVVYSKAKCKQTKATT